MFRITAVYQAHIGSFIKYPMKDMMRPDWLHFNSSINQEQTACLWEHLKLMQHSDVIKYVQIYIKWASLKA